MLSTILSAFTVPEIRKKLAFTALLLALYRVGSHIPVPGVDVQAVKDVQESFGGGGILNLLNTFSGGGLSRIALFALGIMPYITASIILQLLTVVVPSLEKLQKEGEVGQARITQYTRYLTVGLAFAQSIGYVFLFKSLGPVDGRDDHLEVRHAARLPDRRLADGGHGAADVDGRADHPARHRQRHLADDLRVDRLGPAQRHLVLVEQPRPGLRRDDAVHRARASSARSSSSRRASAGSRSSTPSASSGGA